MFAWGDIVCIVHQSVLLEVKFRGAYQTGDGKMWYVFQVGDQGPVYMRQENSIIKKPKGLPKLTGNGI